MTTAYKSVVIFLFVSASLEEMLTSAPQLAASPIVEVTRLLAWLVSRGLVGLFGLVRVL